MAHLFDDCSILIYRRRRIYLLGVKWRFSDWLYFKIEALEAENQSIQGQLLQQKIEIQLKSISGDKVSGDISKLQEENNKLKEDILFYEKIVGKKR